MENIEYYKQTPIMRRILEYVDNAVYVLGANPNSPSNVRRHSDVIQAMGEGSDLYRSLIDFSGINFYFDMEYGNRVFPGEIFHNSLIAFEKIESSRLFIKDFLSHHKIKHMELMTGQGYNFVSKIERNTGSYNSLVSIGKKLKVLPWSAAVKLMEKESKYGNIPLLEDALAFGALGKISSYLVDKAKKKISDLPVQTSDVFDSDEIIIFDTSQYGYLIHKRSHRSAFSLHQKSRMKPELGYHGPPIVTIPPKGLSLENRIHIRSDERDNYKLAVALAKDVETKIPSIDMSSLITEYLMSDMFQIHKTQSQELETYKLNENDLKTLSNLYPQFKAEEIFWTVPQTPDWNMINKLPISAHARKTIDKPNDLLLKPWDIRNLVYELKDKGVSTNQIISLIAFKYNEKQHGWGTDLTKNDVNQRAEYWVRSLT